MDVCISRTVHAGLNAFKTQQRENACKYPPKSYTLCSKKSDAKIYITITTAYLIRIKYLFSGLSFNYHLSDVNVANFNKIHRTVSEQQLF